MELPEGRYNLITQHHRDRRQTTLTVKAGSTVVWTNKDDIPHTVTSDSNAFSSQLMDTNAKFQFTFAKPGKYLYHCKLHAMMTFVTAALALPLPLLTEQT